ncbi:MAG TPA: histidine kinase, partial [Chitinophagaceae bacterium]
MTPGIFTKRPVLSFFIQWIAWILLYLITYLPTLLNSTKIYWDYLLYNHVLLGSINFFLFYLVAFYILPVIGIRLRKWVLLTIICIVLVFAFSYLKFRVEMYRMDQATVAQRALYKGAPSARKPIPESRGVFSYRFRIYIQTNIYYTLSIIFIAFAYRLLIAWYLQERLRR